MKTFWDRFAFAYDAAEALNKGAYHKMLERIAALIPQNAIVLECAAGTGAISIAVAPKAERVLCTDLSLPMLEQARKKVKKKKLRNITFNVRDLLHLPDSDESFDVVIAANVIHLLDDPHAALREAWRVTKKGGLLIVPTFLTDNGKNGFSILIKLYGLLGFKPKHNFSEGKYRLVMESSELIKPNIEIIQGHIPVGFAVFRK